MAAKKVVKLSVIRNKRVKANVRMVRDAMIQSAKDSVDKLGDDLAGYALVAWSKTDGEPYVSYSTDMGPVGPALISAFVANALTERVILSSIVGDDDDEDTGER